MSTRKRWRWYRSCDAALLRAAVHTDLRLPEPGGELGEEAEVEPWCGWLAQVWAQAPVAEAVTVASPVLAARIEAVCAGQRPGPGQVRRMVVSLARYLARMRGRATPFGLFAGVAPLRFGQQTSVRQTEGRHVRTRADAVWLAEVITRLESCAALRHRLPVQVNDLVSVREDRVTVSWQPHAGPRGRDASTQVSVRHSPAVQTVLDTARSPIQGGDLIAKLAAAFPDASLAAVEDMVAQLVACGVLITSVRPTSTDTDGLAHVLERLQDVEADELAEVAPLVGELRAIQTQLATGDTPGCADRQTVIHRMRALSDVADQPLMVDLRLGGTVVLPTQVAAEAEAAAEALLRLSPHPAGHPAWREYHTRFVDRYGAGALVPVEQLADATAGLGVPAHYQEPFRQRAHWEMSRRDERLLALAQQAALDGAHEIELDDNTLEGLAVGEVGDMRPAPHAELLAEVHAATADALTRGTFTLTVLGAGRTAPAMTGRFLDQLCEEDRQRMVDAYGRLPTTMEDALPAQLSFPPRHQRMENVTRAPRVLPEMIGLAEHRDDEQGRIPLRDLAVTADTERLYVVSLSRGRAVEPVVTNAAALHTWPPIARLLFDVPRAHTAAMAPFAWGAASCLPFLPRVRYGRSVLAPARWRLPVDELPGPDAPWPGWMAALTGLRERLRLPTHVRVGTADRQLRLNLDEPMDLTLLRAHLDTARSNDDRAAVRAGDKADDAATVTEAPTPAEHGWLAGRAHEIVIPVATATPPAPAPAAVTRPAAPRLIGREHGVLPGQRVAQAQLYGHPDHVDAILVDHLPRLLTELGEESMWWFVRYRDPHPHLRLRLHPPPDDYGATVVALGAWAAELRRRGLAGDLTLDTYHPETPRYGSGAALTAAEALFAADSAAARAQISTQTAASQVHRRALTAASMVDYAAAMAGGQSAGMRWLMDRRPNGGGRRLAREEVDQAARLADPADDHAALRALASGDTLAQAWQARHRAAAAYVSCLVRDPAAPSPEAMTESLLHLHHNRALGIDPDGEQLTDRMPRAVALAWSARREKGPR